MLPDGILYVRIPNFSSNDLGKKFSDLIENLNLTKTKGMIIDLRYNSGGSDQIASIILSGLIDDAISLPLKKYPQYIGDFRAWGRDTKLLETSTIVTPRRGKTYLGPLVVLTGTATASTAEDVALALHFSGRAVLVGEKTAGSAGNPIYVPLPGGGVFRTASFRAYFPDGTEYVHIGVTPDVEVQTTQKDIYAGKHNDALDVFKMTVNLYPGSLNAYDSLGEAYMNGRNKELAIENYEKSLLLNPDSQSAKDALKKLRGKK